MSAAPPGQPSDPAQPAFQSAQPVSQIKSTNGPDLTRRFFWAFAATHLIAWVIVCALTQPNLPLDMVEMVYWGQQWELGYSKHPPLPAWIAAGTWAISGHQPWAMYLVSQLTIVVTFWAVWQLGREFLSPWAAIAAVVALEGCYYCSYMINDINNTIMTRPMWALAVLFLYRAITRPQSSASNLHWCLAGVAISLGLLCKYYIGVLVLAMLAVPVLIPSARRHLKTPGPYLMAGIAVLIFSPHVYWMANNDFVTIKYIFARSSDSAGQSVYHWSHHVVSPVKFLLSQSAAVIPVVLLLLPLISARRPHAKILEKNQQSGDPNAIFSKYVAIVFLGPIAVYCALALTTGASIRSMWGGPLFSFLGVFILAKYQRCDDHQTLRKVMRRGFAVGALMLFVLAGRNALGPAIRGELSRVNFPGREISDQVNQIWRQRYGRDIEIAGGQMFVAGCVGIYSPQHVDVFVDLNPISSPWVDDQLMAEKGGVILWEHDELGSEPPEFWRNRYPNAEVLPPMTHRSRAATGGLSESVGIILVPPSADYLAQFQSPSSSLGDANVAARPSKSLRR